MNTRPLVQLFAAATVATFATAPAFAAESYDNCTATITSLPATISTAGVWCLKTDLSTAITSGSAITVAANNVTIDCNDFRIGGLAAGTGTQTTGITIGSRLNAIVRHCNIRGFHIGVNSYNGGGHLVEGNRITGSTVAGIQIQSAGSIVARNVITDTGGTTAYLGAVDTTAISVNSATDVVDNVISGIEQSSFGGSMVGIASANNAGATISGNRIRGFAMPVDEDPVYGIFDVTNGTEFIEHNFVHGPGGVGIAIYCPLDQSLAIRNAIAGFGTEMLGCQPFDNAF